MSRRADGVLAASVVAGLFAAIALAACSRQVATAALPDFSGWWVLETPMDGEFPLPFSDAPYKPEIARGVEGLREAFRQAKLPDLADLGVDQRRTYCVPPRFAGFNGGFEDSVEFLFTPGRVTITNEAGLIRRIALDAPLPASVEESNAGTAVAHWEGQTLVVETTGTHRKAMVGFFSPGPNVGYVERISLREPDVLQIALRITAPDVLTKPYETTLVYRRDRQHVFHDGPLSPDSCVDDDPSIDPATGKQRLDMTPPPDLPPPPRD